MGFSFWDVMHIVAPIAATAIGGPGAGIAVSGAMGAGKGIAKGEGAKGALLRGGLGAGTGAALAGVTGGLSKGAEQAAAKTIEKGAMEASMPEILKAGLDAEGMPIVTDMAMRAAEVGGAAAEHGTKAQMLQKFADITHKAQGGPKEAAMLKTVGSGSRLLGEVAQAARGPERPPYQFADVTQSPGISPTYQFGSSWSPNTINFF